MKKIFKTSLLALMMAGAIACSKDDKKDVTNNTNNNNTPTQTPEEMIVGDWDMDDFDQDGDASSSGSTIYTYVMTGSNFSGHFTFNADNTYKNDTEYDIEITYDITGVGQTTSNDHVTTTDQGTWEINADGDLELTSDNGGGMTQVVEITTLTKNSLVLTANISQTQTQGGQTAVVTANSTLSFSK